MPIEEKPAPSKPPSAVQRKNWLKRGLFCFLGCGVFALLFIWYIGVLGSNLREISPGTCYRSAQLKPQILRSVIAEKNIRSVLNLRGERKKADWYGPELAACQAAHIDHTDINIGLGELPRPEAIQQLIEKLEAGPYPMLMHCRAGADRSSLGAVLYVHLVEKKTLETAEAEQMTWRYGHFGIGEAKYINAFFKLYHDTSKGQPFKEWVFKTYPSLYPAQLAKNAASD